MIPCPTTTMDMMYGLAKLEWLVRHELNAGNRHRRPFSLLMVATPAQTMRVQLLENILRRSDELIALDCGAAVLMSETGRTGVLKAAERYKSAFMGEYDMRFAVTTFPRDGDSVAMLLQSVQRRAQTALTCGPGAIVSTG